MVPTCRLKRLNPAFTHDQPEALRGFDFSDVK
jgi:hypothetical protein